MAGVAQLVEHQIVALGRGFKPPSLALLRETVNMIVFAKKEKKRGVLRQMRRISRTFCICILCPFEFTPFSPHFVAFMIKRQHRIHDTHFMA